MTTMIYSLVAVLAILGILHEGIQDRPMMSHIVLLWSLALYLSLNLVWCNADG